MNIIEKYISNFGLWKVNQNNIMRINHIIYFNVKSDFKTEYKYNQKL